MAIVIPAYNEAATIRRLAQSVLEAMPSAKLVVVDDGSTDRTATELDGLPLQLLRNSRNLGKGASLCRGFDAVLADGADVVLTMDGDGQHRAEDIPRLLAAAECEPDRIVIGARLHDRKNFPLLRYLANQCARLGVSWAAGYPVADSQSGFRAYPAFLLARVLGGNAHQTGFAFESEILVIAAKQGVQSIAVAIPGLYPEQSRHSHFRPVRDTIVISAMLLGHIARRKLRMLD